MSTASFAYDIFLSHNRAQKDWTRSLARRLRDDGFTVWFDEWMLPKFAGRNWIDLLVEGVEQSRKILMIWSPEFFITDWPQFESAVIQQVDAIGRKARVLPLLHTPCDVPKGWGFREALDFTSCGMGTLEFEFRYQQLLHNLDNHRPFEGDFERFKAKSSGISARRQVASVNKDFEFDVFLSYNRQDKPQVRRLAEKLQFRGIRVWLDEWEIAPGSSWQQELEKAISKTKAAAVLVGSSGIGPWQNEEMRAAITAFVERRCPVIPVLLPDAPTRVALPLFLRQFNWVDLRNGITAHGIDRMLWGITGVRSEDAATAINVAPEGAKVLQMEDVFCTSGLPAYTYVEPDIYHLVASDLRQYGKHIMIAGPSGSGKTCLVFRLLTELGLASDYEYLSALEKNASKVVLKHLNSALDKSQRSIVIIDDFHLLKRNTRVEVGKRLKYLADLAFARPGVTKFVLIGISSSPEGLLVNAPDLGPRMGVYRMPLASSVDLLSLMQRGEQRLAIEFSNADRIVDEACGSYFVCQFLCKMICLENRIYKTADSLVTLDYEIKKVRQDIMAQLAIRFKPMLSSFAMSNGSSLEQSMPALALVAALSGIPKSLITIDEVAAVADGFADVIRAIKSQIPEMINKSASNDKFSKHLYCEPDSDLLSVEDPVFRYFLNHIDLTNLCESLGIPSDKRVTILDIHAISVKRYARYWPELEDNRSQREVFILSSHRDRKWLETLLVHLKPLKTNICTWTDLQIAPGQNWAKDVEGALSRAAVVVLLVTPDYLASDLIMSRELQTLLERNEERVHILWIPLNYCAYQKTLVARYDPLWPPDQPLVSLPRRNRDNALVKIVRKIAESLDISAQKHA